MTFTIKVKVQFTAEHATHAHRGRSFFNLSTSNRNIELMPKKGMLPEKMEDSKNHPNNKTRQRK
jgi:hypothetical protein